MGEVKKSRKFLVSPLPNLSSIPPSSPRALVYLSTHSSLVILRRKCSSRFYPNHDSPSLKESVLDFPSYSSIVSLKDPRNQFAIVVDREGFVRCRLREGVGVVGV